MKKFTALMLIIALTLSMVACNGNTDVTTDDTTATATEAVSATATDTEATTETAKATTEKTTEKKTTEKKTTEQTTEKKTTEQKTTESTTTTPRTEQPTTEAKRTEQPTTEAPRTEQPTEARTEATTEAGCQHEWEEYGHVETKYKTVTYYYCYTCKQKFTSYDSLIAHQKASEVWDVDENGDPVLLSGCGGSSEYEEQVEDGTVYVADGYRCRKCGATK